LPNSKNGLTASFTAAAMMISKIVLRVYVFVKAIQKCKVSLKKEVVLCK
jgi:hypothetical protein